MPIAPAVKFLPDILTRRWAITSVATGKNSEKKGQPMVALFAAPPTRGEP
jgi:hypothetical protein